MKIKFNIQKKVSTGRFFITLNKSKQICEIEYQYFEGLNEFTLILLNQRWIGKVSKEERRLLQNRHLYPKVKSFIIKVMTKNNLFFGKDGNKLQLFWLDR